MGCELLKNSYEKAAVGKADDNSVVQLWLLKKLLNGPDMSSPLNSLPLSLTSRARSTAFSLTSSNLLPFHARGDVEANPREKAPA